MSAGVRRSRWISSGLVEKERIQLAMRSERKSPACEDRVVTSADAWEQANRPQKEQGRRRSITLTALPAPDIEIGLRHPVNRTMPRNRTGICDPVHNRRKKVPAARVQGVISAGGQP